MTTKRAKIKGNDIAIQPDLGVVARVSDILTKPKI